jgi:hypothetical protein
VYQAADALFPGKQQWVWEQGAERRKSLVSRLSASLLNAVIDRKDLYLSGRDLSLPFYHPRINVPTDLYVTATIFVLNMLDDSLQIIPPGGPTTRLVAIRVESVEWLGKGLTEEPAPRSSTARPRGPASHHPRATKEEIRQKMRAVYDEAAQEGAHPPNSEAVYPLVADKLEEASLYAQKWRIREVAGEPEFERRRHRPGNPNFSKG